MRTLAPHVDPRNANALIADFPPLPPGGYLLLWRVVSADGHPVGGHFTFWAAVGPPGSSPAALLAGTPAPPDPPLDHPAHAPAGLTGEPPIIAAVTRGAGLGALMALAGLGILLTWVVRVREGRIASLERALAIATPALLAADFMLWLQHASVEGSISSATISAALSTQNGGIYVARVALTVAAAWALLLVRRPGLAAVFSTSALLASAATGHPAAIVPEWAIPGKAVHLVGGGLWMAGLLFLILSPRSGDGYVADARRISTVALISVIAVAFTGVIETRLFLPSWNLFSSLYGRFVLGKIVGLSGLLAFGWWHRYRALPRLAAGAGATSDSLRRSVSYETGWMTAVVLLAALLAYVPPPAAMASAEHQHPAAALDEDP